MARTEIDRMDRRILETLQAEGRLSNVELADRVALSPSPCLRRVKRLEDDGVIAGYRAVVDRAKVGLGLTVFVEIKAGKHSRENAANLSRGIATMPEVVSCHIVSGTADFLAEIVVPDLAAYEHFMLDRLLALPTVEDVRSYFAIRTLKTAAPLPLGHLG